MQHKIRYIAFIKRLRTYFLVLLIFLFLFLIKAYFFYFSITEKQILHFKVEDIPQEEMLYASENTNILYYNDILYKYKNNNKKEICISKKIDNIISYSEKKYAIDNGKSVEIYNIKNELVKSFDKEDNTSYFFYNNYFITINYINYSMSVYDNNLNLMFFKSFEYMINKIDIVKDWIAVSLLNGSYYIFNNNKDYYSYKNKDFSGISVIKNILFEKDESPEYYIVLKKDMKGINDTIEYYPLEKPDEKNTLEIEKSSNIDNILKLNKLIYFKAGQNLYSFDIKNKDLIRNDIHSNFELIFSDSDKKLTYTYGENKLEINFNSRNFYLLKNITNIKLLDENNIIFNNNKLLNISMLN